MAYEVDKLTLKRVELPLNKFNDVAIPHHLNLLQKHKTNIQRFQFQHDWEKVRIEQTSALRVVRQLKQLLYEMDTLRGQVRSDDIDKFDQCTLKSRETVQRVIKDYLELTKIESRYQPADDEYVDRHVEDLKLDQIQLQAENLTRRDAYLKSTDALQNEIEDLHTVFKQLGQMVYEQGEVVDNIEQNVETARTNIAAGTKTLRQATRLKAATYPIAGACIGTCIAGPIGFIAGLKCGGLAAIACGIAGYTGGRFIKKKVETGETGSSPQVYRNVADDKRSAL